MHEIAGIGKAKETTDMMIYGLQDLGATCQKSPAKRLEANGITVAFRDFRGKIPLSEAENVGVIDRVRRSAGGPQIRKRNTARS